MLRVKRTSAAGVSRQSWRFCAVKCFSSTAPRISMDGCLVPAFPRFRRSSRSRVPHVCSKDRIRYCAERPAP